MAEDIFEDLDPDDRDEISDRPATNTPAGEVPVEEIEEDYPPGLRDEGELIDAIRKRRENTRQYLAATLVLLVAIIAILMPTLAAFDRLTVEESITFIETLYPPLVPLAAAALAFYFADPYLRR